MQIGPFDNVGEAVAVGSPENARRITGEWLRATPEVDL
jgi:hypothetical protein